MLPFLSTTAELRTILGEQLYRELLDEVKDKRAVFSRAAAYLDISEVELFMRLSRRLGIPLLTTLSAELMRVSVSGVTESELMEKAFVFFSTDSPISGVACVDPSWLTRKTSRFLKLPTLLAPWSLIRAWLFQDISDDAPLPTFALTGEKALDSILKEAIRFSSKASMLTFHSNLIRYDIIGNDLVTHSGEIRTPEADKIKQALTLCSLKEPHIVPRVLNGTALSITVSPIHTPGRFHIQWS